MATPSKTALEKTAHSLVSPSCVLVTPEAAEQLADACDFVVLVIDMQKRFCAENIDLHPTCDKISSIIPKFRAAGCAIYGVYLPEQTLNDITKTYERIAPPDFFNWTPDPSDEVLKKETGSALRSGDTARKLEQSGRKNLVIIGFNTSACVQETVLDALNKKYEYNVFVVSDLTGDNFGEMTKNAALKEMEQKGATVITSDRALKMFKISA